MIRTLVVRGLATGALAGILAGIVAYLLAEPTIQRAIELEVSRMGPAELTAVGRGGQRAGVFLATGLYGLAAGGLFALVFAAVRGRLGDRGDGVTALGLAAVLFVAVVVVPFLKYPPNPPGVGNPAAIQERTLLFLTTVVASLLLLLAAWRVARLLPSSAGSVVRVMVGCAAFAATVSVVLLVLPRVDDASAFPTKLLWEFRAATFATQLAFWSLLGLGFAGLCRRLPLQAGDAR